MATIQRSNAPDLFKDLCGPDAVNFEQKHNPADYQKTVSVSPIGFVSIIHQYFSRWCK